MMNLNWAEKYGVRLIFGKVPEITLNDALENFTQVEKLYTNKSKGNLLHLAKVVTIFWDQYLNKFWFKMLFIRYQVSDCQERDREGCLLFEAGEQLTEQDQGARVG